MTKIVLGHHISQQIFPFFRQKSMRKRLREIREFILMKIMSAQVA